MDSAKHLYTILAITAFMALPVVLDHGAEARSGTDAFDMPDLSRAAPSQPRAPQGVRPETEPTQIGAGANLIRQRWIDDPTNANCRPSGSRQAGTVQPGVPQRSCLIV